MYTSSAHPHSYRFCVHLAEANSVWAAETAPPCHGSLLHSGGSATVGSISRNCPRLLAAPERLVAPLCLGAGGKTEQGPFGGINCPFGSVSLLPVWLQEKRKFKTESARKLNPLQDIFSTSMTSLIQNNTQQLVGMVVSSHCWNA